MEISLAESSSKKVTSSPRRMDLCKAPGGGFLPVPEGVRPNSGRWCATLPY